MSILKKFFTHSEHHPLTSVALSLTFPFNKKSKYFTNFTKMI